MPITIPIRVWKPTADQLRAIRAYCAKVEGKKPRSIFLEAGERHNIDDPEMPRCINICRVSKSDPMNPDWGWDDTDLTQHRSWDDVKRGIALDKRGCAVIDFYISRLENFGRGIERGELLGNAQAYVRIVDGKPRIVGFSATSHPYETANV